MKKWSIGLLVVALLCICPFMTKSVEAAKPSVEYVTHVQNIGWMAYVKDGATSGTTGKSLAVEAIGIRLKNISGSVLYQSHVKNEGWLGWNRNNEASGTMGKGLQMEAIRIKLSGMVSKNYDIYYRVHAGDGIGWMGWTKNGEIAGSIGCGLRIEAIQIKLRVKTSKMATSQSYITRPILKTRTHVAEIGWQSWANENVADGTTGKGLQMEAMIIKCKDLFGGSGISYRAHVANEGWQSWRTSGNIAGTTGKGLQMEAIEIKLTGKISLLYDVYYRVHVENEGWMGWTSNGQSAGTTGGALAIEAIQVKLVRKGETVATGGTAYYVVGSTSSDDVSASLTAVQQNIYNVAIASVGTKAATYQKWAGLSSSTAWCVAYATWVANQGMINSGYSSSKALSVVPKMASTAYLADWFRDRGRYYSFASWYNPNRGISISKNATISSYIPKVGDLVAIDNNGAISTGPEHTGIVIAVNGDTITLAEGNTNMSLSTANRPVKTYTYKKGTTYWTRTDYSIAKIVGFGNPAY